ncbi:coiled-coil domain-containing protein 9 isoform X2 [Rhineura floridana]|uniref:coiled-coil domain-containing protein 9 isoform X2 n=1 Tax=Rhineura floridana TaxID=261503 RepID=UPI002AC84A68|nr:coiled-coil domain-containing protein 9 isoform X2 [Rhineura floridana]
MSVSLDLKSKEDKDAELDKRIEALRRKNQALIKRYQEIEEDRRKAEQEGIAVTGIRRPRSVEGEGPERRRGELDSPTLTVQVLLSPEEKRVVSSERKPPTRVKAFRSSPNAQSSVRGGPYPGSRSPPKADAPPGQPSWEGAGREGQGDDKRAGCGGRGRRLRGRAGRAGPAGDAAGPDRRSQEWEERRRQNIERMNEEMEKIADYERSQRDGLQEKNPVRNFLDDPRRSGPFAETDRREGSRRHMRNWGGADFDKVKTGMEQGKEWLPPVRGVNGRGSARRRGTAALDMTLSMTGRERAEYIRWKREREQIDRERLARHRQPTGEWRREWDAEKTDAAFKEGAKLSDPAVSRQESKRPPKPPTFGQFLSEQQPERQRRKNRGQGGRRGGPSKPYSMHDNRWEEPDPAPAPNKVADAVAQQEEPPASPPTGPGEGGEEEEEDQWEDVSEEEEEAEGCGSRGYSTEEAEEEPDTAQPPSHNRHLSLAVPPPQAETADTEGTPLTPFSPAEGYHPVSDWGEEMDLSSSRADAPKGPLAVPGEEPSASAGMEPPNLLAEQGALLASSVSPPGPRAPQAETSEDLEAPTAEAGAAQEPGEQGAVTEPVPGHAPSTVEITSFQQEQTEA